MWIDQSEITVLTISVPTKASKGALLAMSSAEWVILVTEISYFPGKKFKKLLRNHQQLVLHNGIYHETIVAKLL